MSIRSIIRNWLLREEREDRKGMGIAEPAVVASRGIGEMESRMTFELVTAINGSAIRVGKYKPNPHGPDWTHELYIIQPDQSVGDAINLLMVLKG